MGSERQLRARSVRNRNLLHERQLNRLCFRSHRLRPAYCAYPLYGRPIFVYGVWYRGPVYVRNVKGIRYLWFRGQWERERLEWRR